MTEKKFCVLYYDQEKGEVVTKSNGDLSDRHKKPSEITIGAIDPEINTIGLYINQGTFKVIPVDPVSGRLQEAYDIRMDESQILDIKYLHGCMRPSIAVLYQDHKESRHVKSYEINLESQEFMEGPVSINNVESGASLIIALPKPFCGILVIGEQSIVYKNGENVKAIPMKLTIMSTWRNIDKNYSRILLGDYVGKLWLLMLQNDGINVTDMTLELLGDTNFLSTISYLDNGVIFAGSTQGDSQLIELKSTKNQETGQYIEVLETYTNLGPIIDFCVVQKQGQNIVACSGAYKSGSIRVIRHGIGLSEFAVVDLPGIKGLWSVNPPASLKADKFLIISYAVETRVLSMAGEEIEEIQLDCLRGEQTLYCGNINQSSKIIQITPSGIYIIDLEDKSVVSWTPNDNATINTCSCNYAQVAISIGRQVHLFNIEGGQLESIASKEMPNEVACININPLGGIPARYNQSDYCAVGLWNEMSVRVFEIPSMKEIVVEYLGGDTIPRSVLFMTLDDVNYLFVSLGDGVLYYYLFNPNETPILKNRKKNTLGTHPVTLTAFVSKDQCNIFACSDRPTVIYSNNKKVLYSSVNLKEVTHMCELETDTFHDSMAISTENQLIIGAADEIQKLHTRTIYLNEMARRICHCPINQSYCILTLNYEINESGEEIEQSFVRLLDDTTFETLDSYKLDEVEIGSAITATSFDSNNPEDSYFVVGTAYAYPEENEPQKGRILVFKVSDQKLQLVEEVEIKGAAYSLVPFNGKLLAAVNSKILLFKWTSSQGLVYNLKQELEEGGNVLLRQLAAKGDYILLGDLMKSMSLLSYSSVEGKITRLASHFEPMYLTSVAMPDTELFYGSDDGCNFYAMQYNAGASTEDERESLEMVGQFHTGELVFNIKPGRLSDLEESNINTMLYTSTTGTLGLIASINEEQYKFMEDLTGAMNKVLVCGLGGFSNEEWRQVICNNRCFPRKNFIDGDLIESYFDLRKEEMDEIAKYLGMTSDDVCRQIEGVSQILH